VPQAVVSGTLSKNDGPRTDAAEQRRQTKQDGERGAA
jgi:hypothetical protein